MIHLQKRAILAALMLIAALAVTACAGGDAPAGQPEDTSSSDETPVTDSRTITHPAGDTEIEGVPQRIVALEWVYVEDLLALGIQPVGVADIQGYNSWVNIDAALSDDAADVGTRQEPNLEAIAELDPDLIIGAQFRHETIYDRLDDMAPTLLFNPYPPEDGPTQYGEMEQTFRTIAEAVDRSDEAEDVLDELDQHYSDAEAQLEQADIDHRYVLAQAFTLEDAPTMRLFTENALAVEILDEIGMESAWDDGYQQYGYSTVGLEALTRVEDANFLYVAQEDDNVFENQWADNAVWQNLRFVEEDRVYPLGGDTWLFGGPLSAQVFVDQVVSLFTE